MKCLGRLAVLCCGLLACDRDDAHAPEAPSASAPSSDVPRDHLAPGELQPGQEQAYGLALPRGLKIIRRFPDSIHAEGPIEAEHVANYVRKRVSVYRVELGAAGTIFPEAKIRDGDPHRTYRIVVSPKDNRRSKLMVEDVTPPPPTKGLSEAERWRRAGVDPKTGRMLNPNEAE